MSYKITSHNSGTATNVLMASVTSNSGESKLSIKGIEQVFLLIIQDLPPGDKTLNLSTINFDFYITHISGYAVDIQGEGDTISLQVNDGGDIAGELLIDFNDLKDGIDKKIPVTSNQEIKIISDFTIQRLTIVIEPILVLGTITV